MSKAFTKEDSDDADNSALTEAYLRQRIAELGGGDYAEGLAYLERLSSRGARQAAIQRDLLPPAFLEGVLPPNIRKDAATLRTAKRYAKQSGALGMLLREATTHRAALVGLLTSIEPSTAESLTEGGRAYGLYARAIRDVKARLAQVKRASPA
ncbi:MAG: hypothetical protein Q8O40_08665 [Chloroflexota bacterium]|nr:hypothetical protein [Chloroflexota bacterium]